MKVELQFFHASERNIPLTERLKTWLCIDASDI